MKTFVRGQASVVDIAMFSVIVSISIVFLQVYSATHSSTGTDTVKKRITDEYASDILQVLAYASSRGSGYETVQRQAVEEVSDGDLAVLVNISLDIRDQTQRLDALLKTWSGNITYMHEKVVEPIDSAQSDLSLLKAELANRSNSFISVLEKSESYCSDISYGMNLYAEAFGGSPVSGSPCSFFTEARTTVSGYTLEVIDGIDAVDDALMKAEDECDEDTAAALVLIQDARCVLGEVNIRIDSFITYAQLGVNKNATLLDMLPAKASLETKTITESISESVYIEDRLAGSGILESAGAAGLRVGLGAVNSSLEESKQQITQGAVLALHRRDYREEVKASVEEVLGNLLTKQGYSYCFRAATCCSRIETGDCGNVPIGSGHANKAFLSLGKEPGEMTLDIWGR